MVTILMDTEGCDIAHEALMLEEYSDSNDRWRGATPVVALPPALLEVGDRVRILRSTAIPQCP